MISESKKEKLEQWFLNKSGFDSNKVGLITNGYYYNKFYISSENHELLCDLEKQHITINSDELSYFTINNNYEIDYNNPICIGEKCNKYTIQWEHKTLGNIVFTLRIYENPQIDNGISIDIEKEVYKCKGLLIRNYKPNLMELENIKTKKSKKLNKKLSRAKNKFITKKLKSDNELWLNVRH